MVFSEFMPFCPLLVLHETADGEWLYVMFEGFSGWVSKKYVAICDSKDEWLERSDPDEFLVVTGREIRLQDDVKNEALSGSLIPMGTKLPLVRADDAPEFINDRETKGCYIVKLPVRGSDGYITDRYSLISIKEDVNIGYLDYTRENVVRQAMKLLGDRYGWAGMSHSNDCSGITGEIYRCFGIKLPIFLGVYEGDPYCISAAGTYYDTSGKMYDTNSVIITNMNEVVRGNGNTWLGDLSKIVIV